MWDEGECEGEEGTPRVYSVGRKSNTTKADIITDPANGLRLGDGVGIFVDDDLREHMVTVLMALMALMVLVVQCCAMLCYAVIALRLAVTFPPSLSPRSSQQTPSLPRSAFRTLD